MPPFPVGTLALDVLAQPRPPSDVVAPDNTPAEEYRYCPAKEMKIPWRGAYELALRTPEDLRHDKSCVFCPNRCVSGNWT